MLAIRMLVTIYSNDIADKNFLVSYESWKTIRQPDMRDLFFYGSKRRNPKSNHDIGHPAKVQDSQQKQKL